MSYNDFYNSSVSVKDLEGFFDEAMGYIDVDKLMPYKAWKEEKIETDGVLQGIHSLLHLNLNPASVQKEYAPAVFTRNLIKAFATGDIYGEMDEEKAQQTSNYYMGRDPRQVLNNMQTAIDAFNADNPDNQLSLSDEQRDNINQTITELTSSGLGQMVPFLFEMALIGTVTEGAGLTPYISRLPGYLRLPAIMGVEEIKMGLAPSAPYHAGTGATFGALGQLTSKIPYKVFEKNFRLLRPFYEKVVKSGWVGASSTQVNEIVQAFSKDLMGDEDFMTEFNNLYGGVLEGKPEDIKELLKTLLVDSFVFGISGAAHLGKNDFKSTAAKKSLISDINKEIEKAKKELDDIGLTTTPGEKLSVDKSIEFYQGILKNSSASKELKAAIKTRLDKISGLVNTAANLQRSIDFEQTVNDFDPNFYFTNPEISGSMLKQLKSDFQNVLKKYDINLFNGVSEIRTVEDLVKSIYTLGNEVGSGFISESSLDLLENLSAGKYNELGDIAITDVVAKEQYMKNQLNEAKSELQKEFASEDIFKVFKLSDKAKKTNKTLQQEIKDNKKDPGIPSEKQKAELITNNIPLVNSIAFNQSLYTKFNLENIPQDEMKLVAEELYYDLIKAVDKYNANESAPETWIRNNLQMRLSAKLRKTGYFNRLVEKGGDDATALMENLSGLEAEISSTSLYSINNMNVTPEVPTRFDTYYKGNEKEATQEYDKIESNIELSEIGNNISSYATTPARASSSFYERIGVPENKVKTETGEYKIRPTRINEKQLDKAQEWLENNFEEIFDILPEGYVPSGEYMATPGEPLIVSDKLGGTATGVQTVLEKLPIYEKTGVREKDKRGVGIEGYTKVKELTPEIKKATLEAFGIREDAPNVDIKENKNLSTLFQSIIYQSDKALTNQVVDNIAVKEIKDKAVINDLRAGKTTSLASEDLVEVLIGQLSLVDSKKYSGEDGRQNLLALLEEVEKNGIPNNAEGNAIRNATVNQVRWERDGAGFKAQAKKAGLTIAEPFRSKSKGVVTTDVDAQNRHIDDAIAIINEFLPDVATQSRNTKTGKEGTFLPAMYKLGSNRLVGNVGSEQGVKLVDVINKNKKSIAEIKDPEVREAWEKFAKLADKFEPANSDKMKGFNIGTILDIAEGDKVVSFLGNDGKAYIYDPTGQKTRPTKGVTIIKGNSRNSKANAIDKVFDKDVIESLRAYDYAFNLSLQKWYNSESAKGAKQKKRAEEFLYRHFQMTTNQVMSDRAFAPFTSILLKDGVQKFYKKGEHVQDAATNTFNKYRAILNNKYDFNFHELLSSDYVQSLTEKSQLDFIDNVTGTNTQIGLEKLLVGPGSEVPAKDLYDFSKGRYVFDILVDNFVSRVTDQVKLTETNKEAAKKITPPESNAGEKQTIETVVENPKEASEVLQVSGEKIRKAKLEGEQNKEQAKKKVIFMIGGPGSGKSNVGKGLQLGREGFKVVIYLSQ
jgi:ABC-type glycerol-3-phosphate transport system substrate-binding protein